MQQARTTDQALQHLQGGEFDIVVSELDLKPSDGFALLAEARKHAYGQKLPWIIVTSRVASEDARRAFELGAADFMTKPVSADLLVAKLKQIREREAVARGAPARFGSKLRVTVSAGVTQLLGGDVNPSVLLARADGALYSAKAEGRDRVVLWTPELDTKAAEAQLRAAQTDVAGARQAGRDLGQETGLFRALTSAAGPRGPMGSPCAVSSCSPSPWGRSSPRRRPTP